MSPVILPGAEPWSRDGGSIGVLLLHGFTGNPSSMRPVAEACAAAGYAVELPRLPGHGTTIDEMMTTTFADWSTEADAAYQRVAARTEQVVVAGLSMGGLLTLLLGLRHPTIAGLICINPLTLPADQALVDMARTMLDGGTTIIPGIGSDIAKAGVTESAYPGTPIAPLVSLMVDGVAPITGRYGDLTMPLLLMNSPQDHVVDPANAEHLAATAGGVVERVTLERSFHVATVDFDAALIVDRALEFVGRVTGT